MTRTDEELRHWAVTLLTAKTDRDKQTRLGASDLSDGCDYCLAAKFLGDNRSTAIGDSAWMGRVLGTAFHATLEGRIAEGAGEAVIPGARAEHHVFFGDIPGYGPVGGTIDVDMVEADDQIVDWKGSVRKKICILIDYMQIREGRPALYGRTNTWVKLSEKEYEKAMLDMAYKVEGYYGQQTLYMHGSGAKRASLVLIARDGTGINDNATSSRYSDPKAIRDVHVVSFDYDRAYAEALLSRASAIWAHLEAGGIPADFTRHDRCFACTMDAKDEAKNARDIDIDVAFPALAVAS